MSLEAIILGCGSSGGVPRVTGDWGACDPKNPKNRRTRCSLLIKQTNAHGHTHVLVDSSPDLRAQLLAHRVSHIDGVLYTHDHADQTHGIDDLRALAYAQKTRIGVWLEADTKATLTKRFGYCFKTPPKSSYPPILKLQCLKTAHTPFVVGGAGGDVHVQPFAQLHGRIRSLGFRFGNIAYSSDLHALPDASLAYLEGLECWIIDALRYEPHPTHLNLAQALALIARIRPKRSILTNLHIDMDYARLRKELPAGVEPAYDGLRIKL